MKTATKKTDEMQTPMDLLEQVHEQVVEIDAFAHAAAEALVEASGSSIAARRAHDRLDALVSVVAREAEALLDRLADGIQGLVDAGAGRRAGRRR